MLHELLEVEFEAWCMRREEEARAGLSLPGRARQRTASLGASM